MTTAIVIPARYASSRFPGKPLAPLVGATGVAKPLIQRSIEAARTVTGVDYLYVATDDARIADAARACGTAVAMTPPECANGTERVAAALAELPDDVDIFVNFQGDALLTPADLVERLIAHMIAHPDCEVATVAVRCSPSAYAHLVADQAQGRVGGTTVVCDAKGDALYFSKRVLPHITPGSPREATPPVLLHLGLYAYRRSALARYAALPATDLEHIEGLEQLRFLYHGMAVAVVAADPPAWDAIELNNPSDGDPIEAILATRGLV
ncbi:3-deoxy-manno-octulosonate cytidylyltransferase [Sphingobium algorifonticola]|uniref:3-deoxy-manno-octulosonate cytidylyltransferase n=1 Tax=Sphingobium algorifonticola TaxID=2008318 RepID=A0A437J7P3_9SPHN|nr:3-deoxy-manno-octulosonate cytidylyltransferase [Sphingobium algorifonticola]RVT41016.1 3-deoxy-manno-octulosonate cytidylyltransferase [Sphingobium algorifonticola]